MQSYIFQIKPPPVHVYHFVSPSPNILSNSSTVIFLKVLHENMVSLSENQKFLQFNQVNITIISILMNSGYTQHIWLQIFLNEFENKNLLEAQWVETVSLTFHSVLRKLLEPSIGASYQISVHLAKQFQRKRFLEINQSETRIACGGHVC